MAMKYDGMMMLVTKHIEILKKNTHTHTKFNFPFSKIHIDRVNFRGSWLILKYSALSFAFLLRFTRFQTIKGNIKAGMTFKHLRVLLRDSNYSRRLRNETPNVLTRGS